MEHHVFLSYSRKDMPVMKQLAHDLQVANLSIWTDEGIEPGTLSWTRTIENAILNAGCLVVILSPDAAQSRWVREELEFAQLQDKVIFLVLARGEERDAIPFGYSTFQWVDIRDNEHYISRIQNLISAIRKRLNVPDSPIPKGLDEEAIPIPVSANPIELSDILPVPFEWCEISAGRVILEDADVQGRKTGDEHWVEQFQIAKYALTNAQYECFFDASDGYFDEQWWNFSRYAKDWRSKNRTLTATAFPGDDFPRTNICWYDAMAFCRWLSYKTGKHISLPTEQQWQRAAQGDDDRIYAWGNTFDEDKCNSNSRIAQTTPVTLYPDGASPFSAMDMTGNVWEWCLSDWLTKESSLTSNGPRALRGGGWDSPLIHLRTRYRYGNTPTYRFPSVGYRLVQLP
ncbi:MAG: SUMF1/EgtB/PvdO family nonheme iron enzyme [Chloroflexota bacterium]